ncbi:hypothetical protein [Corynebacterium flavescens]|uniref:hypothetical protein n=1 Tax=Corynebacterium flavescens TaxID=28028 RepID=UPI003FD178D3
MAGFALLPALSAVASLILLPLVARLNGADGWVALVVGQSAGNIVSVVGGLAWFLIGGDRIAKSKSAARRKTYWISLYTRFLVLVPAASLAAVYLAIVKAEFYVATLLFMVGIAGNALSAAWYYAGTGEPSKLVICEGLPRVASYIAAIPCLLLTHNILYYAALTVISQVISFWLNHMVILRGFERDPIGLGEVLAELRDQVSGLMARFSMALSSSGGPALLGIFAPSALPVFSALDAVSKAGINATGFLPSAFVSWLRGTPSKESQLRRARNAVGFILATSALGICVWQVAGSHIVGFLFDNQVLISSTMVALVGATVFSNLISYSLELLVLVPSGYSKSVFTIQMIVAISGLFAFPFLGALGALFAFSIYSVMSGVKVAAYLILIVKMKRQLFVS